MNLVAHQYLSFENPSLQIGNLLGEVVKGKDWQGYSTDVAKGILLHREIDTFTDSHPLVKNCSRLLHDELGKYSPVAVDVVFDYFLIHHWKRFSKIDFSLFKANCYTLFKAHLETFPERLQYMIYYLISDDWFGNYGTAKGQQATLTGIGKRTPYENNLNRAWPHIQKNIPALEQYFLAFFPELKKHCQDFLET